MWGVYYCYKSNAAGDNKDFIVRVICIGLPVMVRVLVFFIPVIILAAVLEFNFSSALIADDSNPEVYETSIYMVAAVVMLSVSYYVYLAKKIRSVSS